MIKAQIAQLMDKEMDRKSFLMHMAAGAVAVFGASTALKVLSDGVTQQAPKATAGTVNLRSYGGAPYGR